MDQGLIDVIFIFFFTEFSAQYLKAESVDPD